MSEQPDLQLNKADAAAALTPQARRLHLAILEAFATTGAPPSRAAIEQAARDLEIDAGVLTAELTERDVVAFDEHEEVRAAYPFSPTPTPHKISWDGGPQAYAMCAIDALGISTMLGGPVTIASSEPGTGKPITIEVDGDRAQWTPDTAVVYAGATGDACCPSLERTCGHINFFTTAESANAWAGRHPEVTGVVLDRAQALGYGIAEFGSLIHAGPPPAA
ncbi:MAG: alkylmercury lyase family protein [Micromonosporaceae bacterium]